MSIIIPNLAIAGYRSFGKKPQYFDSFTKVNLLIGRNNAGKSNVIRFMSEMYPQRRNKKTTQADPLMHHLPDKPPLLIGVGEFLEMNSGSPLVRIDYHLLARLTEDGQRESVRKILGKVLNEKRKLDGKSLCWSLLSLPERTDKSESWRAALKVLDDYDLRNVWGCLMQMQGGDRKHSWEPGVAMLLPTPIEPADIVVIPAIRQIGAKDSTSQSFDGNGIIDKLARLQNPGALSQVDRQKFQDVTKFLCAVIDRPDATIEVPHDRDTIVVHMDGKALPIESLGTGIHEVLILAAAATVLTNHVVCIEEPELHLNPILQRKLIRYLTENTNNQYFISTHSPALMDTPGVEIYHVKLENRQSIVERVTSDSQRSVVCEDLGYHPSDLLQANSIIWVEGPSDRVYVNYWIKSLAPELIEGVHYSIMFYGGRLASHLTYEDKNTEATEINDFISLRCLNRRGAILMDSDREKQHAKINNTKRRLQKEFDSGPGHAWITDGREIENYLPTIQLNAAIAATVPQAKIGTSMGKYDNCLKTKSRRGREAQASKVEVARYIVKKFPPDFSMFDLKSQTNKLIAFIRSSNP